MKCNNCKEELISCDGGYGHKFKIGETIYCKKKKPLGSLHYCDISEIEDAILDGTIRTYGVEAKVVKG